MGFQMLLTDTRTHLPPPPFPHYLSRADEGLLRLYGVPDLPQVCGQERSAWVTPEGVLYPGKFRLNPRLGLRKITVAPCSTPRFTWTNTITGESIPERCRNNWCLSSTRVQVDRLAAAIALSGPETMFRYSLVPDDWPQAQRKMNRLHQYLRDQGRTFQAAYAIERNPSGRGQHVHGYMYGDPVDDILGLGLERAGLGSDHDLQEVTHAGRLGYPMKQATHSQRSLDDYLRSNGGMLIHATRGFWRDGPDGPSLTQRDAARIGWRRLHPPNPLWVRVATG